MTKTLNNSTVSQAKDNVGDLEVVGNGDMFRLLCKASSKKERWMKSTKAMAIPGAGCVVQVTTQQGDRVAEAVTFVPGVTIEDDDNDGRKLVADPSPRRTVSIQAREPRSNAERAILRSPDAVRVVKTEMADRFADGTDHRWHVVMKNADRIYDERSWTTARELDEYLTGLVLERPWGSIPIMAKWEDDLQKRPV